MACGGSFLGVVGSVHSRFMEFSHLWTLSCDYCWWTCEDVHSEWWGLISIVILIVIPPLIIREAEHLVLWPLVFFPRFLFVHKELGKFACVNWLLEGGLCL